MKHNEKLARAVMGEIGMTDSTRVESIDAELVQHGDADRMVRQAIDGIFAQGAKPVAIVVFADYGDRVGLSVAGAPAHLAALAEAGNDLLANMLRQSMQARELNG